MTAHAILDDDMTAHEAARRIQNGPGPVCVFASILPGQHEWIAAVKYDVVQTLKRMHPTTRVHLKVTVGDDARQWFFLSQRYED